MRRLLLFAILVACVGLAVNLLSAWLLHGAHGPHRDHHHEHSGHAHHHDHNLRAAYLHVLADALTSLLAIVALGMGYLLVFSHRFLPNRTTIASTLSAEEVKEYITQVRIDPESHLIGKKLADTPLAKAGMKVAELIRGDRIQRMGKEMVLKENDILLIRGDVNKIRIGRNTNVQDGTIIHCNSDRSGADYRDSGGGMATLIGDDVTIGHLALIHACRLESNCFIGMRAVVMDEAVVEPQAMVAAGALVSPRKVVGGGELWAGVPAKFRRHLGAAEQDEAAWIAQHYVELAQQHLTERN